MSKMLRRDISEIKAVSDDGGIITVTFASPEPYLRSFGWEVLDISESGADLEWAKSGNCPFLLDHVTYDAESHIGVVTDAWIDGNKCKASIRLSPDECKEGIINDIKSGIRPNISFGYKITGKVKVGSVDGLDVFKCSFAVWEISSVSIPADPTVGTNRADDAQIETINEIKTMEKTESTELESKSAPIQAQTVPVQEVKGANAADVIALCRKWGMDDKAEGFVRSGATMEFVKEAVFSEWEARSSALKGISTPAAPAVHTRTQDPFTPAKAVIAAVTGDWSQAGLEREQSQEHARAQGKVFTGNNFFIDPNMSTRAGAVGTATGGAELVGTTFRPDKVIDLLVAKTASSRLGVDMSMTGLVGMQAIPKFTSGLTASWGTETAIAAETSMGTASVSLTPKQLTAKSKFSRQLLIQALPNIDAKVMGEIYTRIALAVDAALIGTQTAVTNAPVGLMNQTAMGVAGANTVVLTGDTNGGTSLTWVDINNLIKLVDVANALDGSLKFLGNAKIAAFLRAALKAASTAVYLMDDNNKVAGYDFIQSNVVPSNFVKGTSGAVCSPLIFGNWTEAMVAQWGAIEVVVDPYTAGDTSEIVLRAYSFWDVGFKHIESFSNQRSLIA